MYCIDVILLIALNNYTAAVAIPSLLIVDYNLTFAWINRSQTLCLHLNKYSFYIFLLDINGIQSFSVSAKHNMNSFVVKNARDFHRNSTK